MVHNIERSGNRTAYSFWDDFNVTVNRNINHPVSRAKANFSKIRFNSFRFSFPLILIEKLDDDMKATFTLPPDVLELILDNMVKDYYITLTSHKNIVHREIEINFDFIFI